MAGEMRIYSCGFRRLTDSVRDHAEWVRTELNFSGPLGVRPRAPSLPHESSGPYQYTPYLLSSRPPNKAPLSGSHASWRSPASQTTMALSLTAHVHTRHVGRRCGVPSSQAVTLPVPR